MPERIHLKEALKIMGYTYPNRKPVPFDITYVKKSTGELCELKNCILTSLYRKGMTVNIQREGEDHPIKIYKKLIIRINGKKVYI